MPIIHSLCYNNCGAGNSPWCLITEIMVGSGSAGILSHNSIGISGDKINLNYKENKLYIYLQSFEDDAILTANINYNHEF